jgi:hypothetical protein
MFSSLTERLRGDIQAIRDVATFTDRVRVLLADTPEVPEVMTELRAAAPKRLVWQIYDHCAALTRLYAVYASFVEELTTEYLRLLPTLYHQYEQLPEPIVRQHRIGIAQILLRLGDAGPYRELQERDVVEHLADGLAGDRPYALLPNAFFIDRQNYRLDALVRLFGFLGVGDLGVRLHRHPVLERFLREKRGESTTLDAELSAFVQRRNEAAHSHVDEIIGLDEFHSLAEFVWTLGDALAELLAREVTSRRVILGQSVACGAVEETHYDGFVVVARMRGVSLARGDELLILHNGEFVAPATIESIQVNDVDCDRLDASDDQEVGIRLSARCIPGNTLARLPAPAQPAPPQLPLFVSEEYPEPDSPVPALEDAEPLSDLGPDANIIEDGSAAADQ